MSELLFSMQSELAVCTIKDVFVPMSLLEKFSLALCSALLVFATFTARMLQRVRDLRRLHVRLQGHDHSSNEAALHFGLFDWTWSDSRAAS
jgi:hypothetical protein